MSLSDHTIPVYRGIRWKENSVVNLTISVTTQSAGQYAYERVRLRMHRKRNPPAQRKGGLGEKEGLFNLEQGFLPPYAEQ